MTECKEWKEVTPYIQTFHVNFKEDVFGLKEFNIATKYNFALIRQDDPALKYKDKMENEFSGSKYSFLNHLNKTNRFHFYQHCCKFKACVRYFLSNFYFFIK